MFNWFKNRRRRKLLATPYPEGWEYHLSALLYYRELDDRARGWIRNAIRIFIAEKTWEGCQGLELTEEMQVLVAGQACVMLLGLDDFYFDNVQTILLYPAGFVSREQRGVAGDLYLEGKSERLGEAHLRGPVILAWDEIEADVHEPECGHNLVIHEFAHQLDMLNGEANGVPLLPRGLQARWEKIMTREYARLQRQANRGRDDMVIDPYGATSPAEFFAVLSECFFDVPIPLEEEHPELYGVLRDFYRQDPAQRRR